MSGDMHPALHHVQQPPQEAPPAVAPMRFLGTVRMMGGLMHAYDMGDGLALLRPVSLLGLEARREWVVPLKSVLNRIHRR